MRDNGNNVEFELGMQKGFDLVSLYSAEVLFVFIFKSEKVEMFV